MSDRSDDSTQKPNDPENLKIAIEIAIETLKTGERNAASETITDQASSHQGEDCRIGQTTQDRPTQKPKDPENLKTAIKTLKTGEKSKKSSQRDNY